MLRVWVVALNYAEKVAHSFTWNLYMDVRPVPMGTSSAFCFNGDSYRGSEEMNKILEVSWILVGPAPTDRGLIACLFVSYEDVKEHFSSICTIDEC